MALAPAETTVLGEQIPHTGLPRVVEAVMALIGLLLAAPFLAMAAALVAVTSPGGAFFRQERVGRNGKNFVLYKLRTMRPSTGGPDLTARGDARITRVGRFLRRTKLDELPQLWNVLSGEMSLVGPRPEVPRYVDPANPLWRGALRVRPGMTDPVSLSLRDEETLLARVAGDRERFYLEELQPLKLREYLEYLSRRSWWTDIRVLGRTGVELMIPRVRKVAKRGRPDVREPRSRSTGA
jgi:lipopolysaccharide/colanic/teichoic acid biosynthesis glycosyltransferase